MFSDLRADVSYGFRMLLRNPGFTAVAIIVLALGIGANVTVFTLANAFLFKNLPFEDSDRILYISNTLRTRPGIGPVGFVSGLSRVSRSGEVL